MNVQDTGSDLTAETLVPEPTAEPSPGGRVGTAEQFLIQAQARVLLRWPHDVRRQAAIMLAITGMAVGTVIASAYLLRWTHQWLDLVAYTGLFLTCWIGAGGLLVPIPGVRWVGFLMIVHHGAALHPAITAFVAALAMVLGQTSWFIAARAAATRARHRASSDPTSAAAMTSQGATTQGTPIAEADPGLHGRRARMAARSASLRQDVEGRLRRHGIAVLYFAGLVPSPLTSIASSTSGAIGIPLRHFLTGMFGGFLTLAAILAFFGSTLGEVLGRFPGGG